jgi:hypothetical protein
MAVFSGRATGAFGGSVFFEWEPDPDVVAMELIRTADRLDDMSQPLLLAREIAISEHLDHFKDQSGPDGEAWAPWASSYEPVARVNNIGDILERTLDLEYAMVDPGAYPISKDSVFFSTGGLPHYWLWNQEGTGSFSDWGRRDTMKADIESRGNIFMDTPMGIGKGQALPARPFVGMSVEAQLRILEVFDMWFSTAITSSFTRGGRTVMAERGAGGRFTGRQVIL